MTVPRLALLTDYPEEQWLSMDLCAEMLESHLQTKHADRFQTQSYCPQFKRRIGLVPKLGETAMGINADRLLNRMWYYPRALRKVRGAFDLFHLCDHSYSQVLHELPPFRTGVFCHDLDTFRCLLEPKLEPRPWWFRRMARRILDGFRKAAIVFYTTQTVHREILAYNLFPEGRLVQAPLGTAAEFDPEQIDPDPAKLQLSVLDGREFLLHVGSCIPRKRIDVLLDLFAAIRAHQPDLRLIKVGGEWSESQRAQIERLRIGEGLHHFQGLSRSQLASLYRRAKLVLITSESEGFGLPAIEALACGAPVLASNIGPLREAAGDAANYAQAGDLSGWIESTRGILCGQIATPTKEKRLTQAGKFTWRNHAAIISDAYLKLGRSL